VWNGAVVYRSGGTHAWWNTSDTTRAYLPERDHDRVELICLDGAGLVAVIAVKDMLELQDLLVRQQVRPCVAFSVVARQVKAQDFGVRKLIPFF
jgi:hypothetical protein